MGGGGSRKSLEKDVETEERCLRYEIEHTDGGDLRGGAGSFGQDGRCEFGNNYRVGFRALDIKSMNFK